MLHLSLLACAAFAAAAPQLDDTLGALAGVVGKDATFDYIVVGGGTAGLAVAKRLSEDRNSTVAVIEAGSFYQVTSPVIAETPAGAVLFTGADIIDTNPLVDWNFVTEPQSGANGRQNHYAQGLCLGGTSARNFMAYQRGTIGSYQRWADAVGDQSYTFNNLLPFFKKSVKFTPPGPTRNPNASAEYNPGAFSPSGGPLEVTYANYAQVFSSFMEASLKEIGIGQAPDFNSGSLFGAQYNPSALSSPDQKRETSQTSFLDEARREGTPNLKVFSLTLAEKVLFDDQKKATGVRCSAAGVVPFTLTASKEVILSAGAFQSPKLLMLSGVGPKDHLEGHNIKVVADRPGVGQNMTDHVFFGPAYRVVIETFTRVANDPAYFALLYTQYTTNHTGILTSPNADFLAWEKIPTHLRSNFSSSVKAALATVPADWPEIELLSAPAYIGDYGYPFLEQPKDGYQYATILGALVAPMSRGTVRLKSALPQVPPAIDPRWLTHEADQAIAVAAFRRLREAFATEAMARILVNRTEEYFPGFEQQTDEQILEVVRSSLMTVWHASVTCRMGRRDDPTAVVDSKAKVIGVHGLRVVDASSLALLPPGHPMSTIYMLAEKISDDIRNGR